jgi:hypothetical protein
MCARVIDVVSFSDFSIRFCEFLIVTVFFLFFIFINSTLKDRLNEKVTLADQIKDVVRC